MQTASCVDPTGALRRRPWLAGAAALWLSGPAGAAGTASATAYPVRPVRILLGGNPGSLGRILADKLAARWGQAVFLEQKNGAGGALATEFLASQPPDGYNLQLTTVSLSAQTVLQRKEPGRGNLLPVAMFARQPFMLVVNNDLPAKTLPELVAHAKANPGKLNFGTAGIGAPGHLCGEMLKQMAGIDMVAIHYKAVPAALTDVMSNQIQMMFAPVSASLALAKAGKLRPLAVSSPQRYGLVPDVPTVAEQGYRDFQFLGWNGLHAPPGTPAALRDQIAAAVAEVLNTPEGRDSALANGYELHTMGRAEFEAFMRADIARIAQVIKDGNIKTEE
ncbi:MAG: tripartite tricarboxylate transporter substrate binding protein [Pseudomonadota bacterium]